MDFGHPTQSRMMIKAEEVNCRRSELPQHHQVFTSSAVDFATSVGDWN
jgi:hypothetical protein